MLYGTLFVWVVYKGFSFFVGSCRIYFNTVIAGLVIGQIYEMLRHPLPGALNIIMKKRTIATMTRGKNVTFYYSRLLAYYIFDDYWTSSVLVKNLPKYFGGFDTPISSPKYSLD